ncbi:MAG: hypothetical protein UX79_C0031G0007 [candidate division WWE3 bacterium GW2011_GWB1_47_11]|uniref:Uncharacterized protein n=2 Tax=Bacteria candidate phyla TaxID=1783234 RepID=A0A0G0RAE7_9BACT|nr:MAG: hypothetical protein UT84_C0030G0005 [Candidatus Curtissbacteria bacterium GW2011_GWA1_40_16]KKU56522.1 MAG: hypothetical protein UX79_C0031G0007 [candidate division WWE3 bacterium GW2011_GWB1_47_11]
MNQITLDKVLDALKDEPVSIGDRLLLLGLSKDEIKEKFSSDILNTAVYGSSFLKFLQDNAKILADLDRGIPAKELPKDYKNPFDNEAGTVAEKLYQLGINKKEVEKMFGGDILNLSVNGEEFQNFIAQNQNKFLGELEKLATGGAKHG